MADYYPLISRAVAGLERNTGENRRSLYERARNALLDQLRNVTPALSESDITRERLALEEAIRKVEADVARRLREEAPRPAERPQFQQRLRDLPRTGQFTRPAPEPGTGEPAPSAPPPPSPESRPPFGRIIGRSDVTAADLRRFPRRPPPPEQRPPEAKPAEFKPPESQPAELRRAPEPKTSEYKPPEYKAPEYKAPEPAVSEVARPSEFARTAAPPEVARAAPEARTAAAEVARTFAPEPVPAPPADELPPEPSSPIAPDQYEPPPREPRFGGAAAAAARARPERRPPVRPEPVDLDEGREPELEAREPEPAEDDSPYRARARIRPIEPPGMEGVRPPPAKARRPVIEEKIEKGRVGRLLNSSLGTFIIAVALIGLVGGALFWKREAIRTGFVGIMTLARGPSTQAPKDTTPAGRAKINDRVGEAAQGSAQPQGQAAATASQHVNLYEEDPSEAKGRQYAGSVTWSLENVAAGPGQPMDKAIRGDIVIPERNMTVTFTIRRNTDKDLPASHTVSIVFTLPANFTNRGIQEIRALLMKQSEQARGVQLAGLSVKVTNGYFLIGLSASEADVQRNIQMLKDRPWFDIAIVYDDNRRAIMAVEKGTQGERVFADAFAAWGQ